MGATPIPSFSSMRAVTIDITPTRPQPLFGYANREIETQVVHGRLEANALELECADGPLYIVSTDALYGGEAGRQIAGHLGTSVDRVLVLGSHTHYAPGVDAGLPKLGRTDPSYVSWIARRCAEALAAAPRFEGVTVRHGIAKEQELFINRRRPSFGIGVPIPSLGRVLMAPNPKKAVDSSVRSIQFVSGDQTIAILWNASCHPVAAENMNVISANFPGSVRASIRARIGTPNLPVLFGQGFSGDVRPKIVSRRPPRSLSGIVHHAAAGWTGFTSPTCTTASEWNERLTTVLSRSLDSLCDSEPLAPRLTSVVADQEGGPRPAELNLVALSSSVSLLCVNGEVVSERVSSLTRLGPFVVPVGCVGEVLGYWPTDQMISEGGYEGCSSQQFFPRVDWASAGGPDMHWHSLVARLVQGSPLA